MLVDSENNVFVEENIDFVFPFISFFKENIKKDTKPMIIHYNILSGQHRFVP
jgi:hypothetical protein